MWFIQQEGGANGSSEQPIPHNHSQGEIPPSATGSSASSAVKGDHFSINAKVIVYAALSGMVSFLSDGTIYGCNHHFAVMLFGYTQEELLKKVQGRYTNKC